MISTFLTCKNTSDCLRMITVISLVIIIRMFVLKYFWNNALVPHVSVLKPITSLLDALMLSLAIGVISLN